MKNTLALVHFVALFSALAAYGTPDSEEHSAEYIDVGEHAAPPKPFQTVLTIHNATGHISIVSSANSSVVGAQNQRIVGGRRISIQQAPWQVAIMREQTFTCGGSIVSPSWVLTAAHCVHGGINRRYAVRAGSDHFKNGGQLRIVSRVAVHGGYNPNTAANDIALLRLQRGFVFNPKVRAVKLASSLSTPSSYSISGWGTLTENSQNPTIRLRGVDVRSVSRTTCARRYRNKVKVTNNQICAASPNQDSCQGDSGGGLISRGTQYGIVSLGMGCARARYPGIYTFVPRYRTWISTVTRIFGTSNSLRFLQRN